MTQEEINEVAAKIVVIIKHDLQQEFGELRRWVADREVAASRWTLGLLALYFFGTLASVWFLVNQQLAQLSAQIHQLVK